MNAISLQPLYNKLVYLQGKSVNTAHGSAFDRGCADAYYGRLAKPHRKSKSDVRIIRLSSREVLEYYHGYTTEQNRKDWGMN